MSVSPQISNPNEARSASLEVPPFDLGIAGVPGLIKFPGVMIPLGRLALIQGENGAGKTTFLRHLRDNSESLRVDGVRPARTMLDQMYEHLIYPYKPVWWNVALPLLISNHLRDDGRVVARNALEFFSLPLPLDRYPSNLSGGEKHVMLLARFSLCQHPVLLLDEPSTALDARREVQLWTALARMATAEGKWMFLVTHGGTPERCVSKHLEFPGLNGRMLTMDVLSLEGGVS